MSGSISPISTTILKMQTDNLLLVALCAHADQVHSLTSGMSCVFAKRRPSSLPSLTLKCELLQQSPGCTELHNIASWRVDHRKHGPAGQRACVASNLYTPTRVDLVP